MRKRRIWLVATALIVSFAIVACGLLPSAQTPSEPTAARSPTPGGEAVVPTPQIYPTPTTAAEVPPSELPTGQALTWLVSGVYPVGEPEDGWQTYRVAVAYENSTGKFVNEVPSCELWSPEVATEEGYLYKHGVDGWSAVCTSWEGCQRPWPYQNLLLSTGVAPPGFRLRGGILFESYRDLACAYEMIVEFQVGELLHPTTLTLYSPVSPNVANVVPLNEVADAYGPVQHSSSLESLPATITMGKARVTIENGVLTPDGLMTINLTYENPDPAREVTIYDPTVALIDSHGYLSARWSWAEVGSIAGTGLPCGDVITYEDLGPLQQAKHHTCFAVRPGATREEQFYLVACGWSESAEEVNPHIWMGQAGGPSTSVDPTGRDCYVYEFNLTPSPTSSSDYYPMAVGNYWVFRQIEPDGTVHESSVEVVATQQMGQLTLFVTRGSSGFEAYYEVVGSRVALHRRAFYQQDGTIAALDEVQGDSGAILWEMPFEVGQERHYEWVFNRTDASGNTQVVRFDRDYVIEAIESVNVPAGYFERCYRARMTYTYSDAPGASSNNQWLCPGVGLVKSIVIAESPNNQRVGSTQELMEYEIH